MTSLKKNMIYNIAYQLLVIILPLITAPYVSRVLGVSGLGTYSYIYSIVTYFGLFGSLGIANQGNRSIALTKINRQKASQVFSNIYIIQLITTTIAFLSYIFFVTFLFSGDKTIAYIQSIMLLSYVLDITWVFFGLEQFSLTVIRNSVIKLATVIAIFAFVRDRHDVWVYALIMSLGMLLSQAYLWFQLHRFVDICKPVWNEVIANIKPILLLFIPAIAYSVYKILDKIMLGGIDSMEQVGLFDSAEKIIGIPSSFITAFGTVMMPRITSMLSTKDVKNIASLNAVSTRYFTIIVVGSAFGLAGVSDVLAPVFFGDEFRASAPVIAGLGFSLIFVTWSNIMRTQYLIPNRLDKPYVISTICGAAANIIVNLVLIPYFGALGAMAGTLVAEFTVFLVQLIFVRVEFPILEYLQSTVLLFPLGMMMCAVVYIVGRYGDVSLMTLVLQILLGGILYLFGVIIYLWIVKDVYLMNVIKNISLIKDNRH